MNLTLRAKESEAKALQAVAWGWLLEVNRPAID
jgi:hypothetical protein